MEYDRMISKLFRAFYMIAPNEEKYFRLIQKGHVPRPHYSLGIYKASVLARRLGHKRISVIEFGCAGGNGLVDIEYHAHEISKITGVEFEIFGFDSGAGLPSASDYRDIQYLYRPGQFNMDAPNLRSRLLSSNVILGLIKDTVGSFTREANPAPIGCIFNDLDYYSSTMDSFEIFASDEKYFLPRVVMYFDDITETSSYTGELGAINSYNAVNETKKIDPIPQFAEELSLHFRKWILLGKRFYYWHYFSHSNYSDYINETEDALRLK